MKSTRSVLQRVVLRGAAPATPEMGVAKLEGQRDQLIARRVNLARKLADAVGMFEAAFATRRDLHLTGNGDAVEMRRAEEQVRAAESEHLGIADALRHLDGQIADAERAVMAAVDKIERERVAAEIDARVERMSVVAAKMDDVAEAFDDARKALLKVWGEDAPKDILGFTPALAVISAAARYAGAVPTSDGDRLLRLPTCAGGVAIPILNRMKAHAAAIRAGEAPPVLPGEPEPVATYRIPDRHVALCRPILWAGLTGQQFSVSGGVELPAPVADACVALGIAVEMTDPDAKNIVRAAARFPTGIVLKRHADGQWLRDDGEPDEHGRKVASEQFRYIDVDLEAYVAAERAKARMAA